MVHTPITRTQFLVEEDGSVRHRPTGAHYWWAYPNSESMRVSETRGMLGNRLDNMEDYNEDEVRQMAHAILGELRAAASEKK